MAVVAFAENLAASSPEEINMTTDVLASIQELATRTDDGLHVRLLWSAVEQRAWVSGSWRFPVTSPGRGGRR